jgi:hypothetical protein
MRSTLSRRRLQGLVGRGVKSNKLNCDSLDFLLLNNITIRTAIN